LPGSATRADAPSPDFILRFAKALARSTRRLGLKIGSPERAACKICAK